MTGSKNDKKMYKNVWYLYYLQCGGWWSPLRWSDVGGSELRAGPSPSPSPMVENRPKGVSMMEIA